MRPLVARAHCTTVGPRHQSDLPMDTDTKTLKTTLAIAALILSSASASSAHAGLFEDIADAVSYTHLTLPTSDLV